MCAGQESSWQAGLGCILAEFRLPWQCCVWPALQKPGVCTVAPWSVLWRLGYPEEKLLPWGSSGFKCKVHRIMHILQRHVRIRAVHLSLQHRNKHQNIQLPSLHFCSTTGWSSSFTIKLTGRCSRGWDFHLCTYNETEMIGNTGVHKFWVEVYLKLSIPQWC